jgi:hypothetical protein
MEELKKLEYDLDQIADAFDIQRVSNCAHIEEWTSATYDLTATEKEILNDSLSEMQKVGDYWNEEELKIQFVGLAFYIAKVNVDHKIRVFYERPISAEIDGYKLAVIADCMVATPKQFSTPQNPYFFLQEFKKGKGEKNDPEAQMLTAMLIAQNKNNDNKPIYGGYLIGKNWVFTTLIGKDYCTSRQFDASQKHDILQIIFNLRHLKTVILKRL